MNTTKRRIAPEAALLALLLSASVNLFGQAAMVAAPSAAKEEAVVLSPFTVSTDRDTGFVAEALKPVRFWKVIFQA